VCHSHTDAHILENLRTNKNKTKTSLNQLIKLVCIVTPQIANFVRNYTLKLLLLFGCLPRNPRHNVHLYKKLFSLQHHVRAMKSYIQNSTNHFFWDNVIERTHIALTSYNPLDVTPVNVSLHSK